MAYEGLLFFGEFVYPPNTGVVIRSFWELSFVEQKIPSGYNTYFGHRSLQEGWLSGLISLPCPGQTS